MFIPRGKYLSVDQYMQKIGISARVTVLRAIKKGQLQAFTLDSRTIIIPEDAIIINHNKKAGKLIGITEWIRSNEKEVKEEAIWERKQEVLRKMREKDLRD
jgi:hypothetical protein